MPPADRGGSTLAWPWPARLAARLAGPGGTDRRTDGRIAALLNAPLPYGGGLNNMVNLHTH